MQNLVFVVDDDPGMLKGLARLIWQLGYASLSFPSAAAFMHHGDFERATCIILDIDVGDVSGIDLGHRLKARNVSVPVVYMSGKDDSAVQATARRSGCLAFLTKPFTAEALAEALARARQGT